MKEHGIQNSIRNELAGRCLLFRANVGKAWQGDAKRLPNGDLLLKNPRPFSTGLPPGFSDLFGLVPVKITPDMVGQTVGVFVALEVKAERGSTSEQQDRFLKAVNDNGGRAAVVRSPDDAVRVVTGEE